MKQRRRGGSAAKNVTLSRTRARGVRAGPGGPGLGSGSGSRENAGGSAPWASGRRGWRRKLRAGHARRLRLGAIPARRPSARRSVPLPSRGAAARPQVRAGPGLRRSETVLPADPVGAAGDSPGALANSFGLLFGPRGPGTLPTGTGTGRRTGVPGTGSGPSTCFPGARGSLRP